MSAEHTADEEQTRKYLLAQLRDVKYHLQKMLQWLPGEPEPVFPPPPEDGDYNYSGARLAP